MPLQCIIKIKSENNGGQKQRKNVWILMKKGVAAATSWLAIDFSAGNDNIDR